MSMMSYKTSMFMLAINFATTIFAYVATFIFPNTGIAISPSVISVEFLTSTGTIITLIASAGVLAVVSFGFLPVTFAFTFALFAVSGNLTVFYLSYLPIANEVKDPIIYFVTIITVVGISQYAARSSYQGS